MNMEKTIQENASWQPRVVGSGLAVDDFDFSPKFGGSQGIVVSKIAANCFRFILGHHPKHPEWSNNPQFRLRNAKGNSLRIEVDLPTTEQDGTPTYDFAQYFQSWSYDRKTWTPAKWVDNGRGKYILTLPAFEREVVHFGVQSPFVHEDLAAMLDKWQAHREVSVMSIGTSLQGRAIYRVRITDPNRDVPLSQRWVHHISNQHGGENNARWRIVGMIQWLLGEQARRHLRHNVFHFVVMMNPDGPANGWRRTNAQGVDMNRSYLVSGADKKQQAYEAYLCQSDLEQLMASDEPITSLWSMHTCAGKLWIEIHPGPELLANPGNIENVIGCIRQNDSHKFYIRVSTAEPNAARKTWWHTGPHLQFGITAAIIEGSADTLLTVKDNLASGEVLARAITAHYSAYTP